MATSGYTLQGTCDFLTLQAFSRNPGALSPGSPSQVLKEGVCMWGRSLVPFGLASPGPFMMAAPGWGWH